METGILTMVATDGIHTSLTIRNEQSDKLSAVNKVDNHINLLKQHQNSLCIVYLLGACNGNKLHKISTAKDAQKKTCSSP